MNITWADRVATMEDPAVKMMLKITQRTDITSFAGGLPSARTFPVDRLAAAYTAVLDEQAGAALQYSLAEGYPPLRELLVKRLERTGIACGPENIVITSGSQQAIDFIGRLLLNPGDLIAVENPAYLAALQPFRSYQASFLPVPMESDGMDVDALARQLKKVRPKFIYVNPNFQNPTGITLGLEKRRRLGELAAEYQIPLLEDNPYGELRFGGPDIPPIKSITDSDWAMYTGTFSKVIAPGLRVGWFVAHPDIANKVTAAKQLNDILTNSLTQRALHRYLSDNDLDAHIATIIGLYRRQRDAMLAALAASFPAGVSWTLPEGGMFIWVTLPPALDARELLPKAIDEAKVAYVPGTPFHTDGGGHNTFRLSFANTGEEEIAAGIARLGALLARHV
jgi:2-aminoadipate transaminase